MSKRKTKVPGSTTNRTTSTTSTSSLTPTTQTSMDDVLNYGVRRRRRPKDIGRRLRAVVQAIRTAESIEDLTRGVSGDEQRYWVRFAWCPEAKTYCNELRLRVSYLRQGHPDLPDPPDGDPVAWWNWFSGLLPPQWRSMNVIMSEFHVSQATLRRAMRDGRLTRTKKVGRTVLLDRSQVAILWTTWKAELERREAKG